MANNKVEGFELNMANAAHSPQALPFAKANGK
jgi:hypothetical protein